MLDEWALHDLGHIRQIAELVRARGYAAGTGPMAVSYNPKPQFSLPALPRSGMEWRTMTGWMVLLALLSAPPPSEVTAGGEVTSSSEDRIEALVVGVDHEALRGVGLSLCPLESPQIHARQGDDNQCHFKATGVDGMAVFERVAPGQYRLTGNLSGFADTTVFPLSIGTSGSPGPHAPDRVVLLLNSVCYDCSGNGGRPD